MEGDLAGRNGLLLPRILTCSVLTRVETDEALDVFSRFFSLLHSQPNFKTAQTLWLSPGIKMQHDSQKVHFNSQALLVTSNLA